MKILKRYVLKSSQAVVALDCQAVAFISRPIKEGGKWLAMGYSGRRSKHDWFYSFRDEAKARIYIQQHFANVKAIEARRTARAAEVKSSRCLTVDDVFAKARENGGISAAETAICLRAVLGRQFPGVKFSVTSETFSMGDAVRVHWMDGPKELEVEAITDKFSFARFDGMIDLKYSKSRWLAPDGSMSLAHSEGTEGSMGTCSEVIGSRHHGAAVLVKNGADYVTCSRRISPQVYRGLLENICGHYGMEIPSGLEDAALNRWAGSTLLKYASGSTGEYLSTLVHRLSMGTLQIS